MAQVLGRVPKYRFPEVLVGYDTADDAGVYKIDDKRALVQTVDFFTPVVDDPYVFGSIAAANSLSDVYAMGGTPITALAIACFPEKGLDFGILAQIMTGGVEKLREAGVALLGGHTVSDAEIKFGYSITGMIDPNKILSNAGARPEDSLVLTKPLGIGILTSGIKFNKTSASAAKRAIEVMSTLNASAAEVMRRYDCRGATDITGNGLLGHGYELAHASQVTLRIYAEKTPYIPEAYTMAEAGLLPRTVATNWQMVGPHTRLLSSVPEPLKNILLDPQTSGGLLISVSAKDRDAMVREMTGLGIEATHIGEVELYSGVELIVE